MVFCDGHFKDRRFDGKNLDMNHKIHRQVTSGHFKRNFWRKQRKTF